MGQGSRGIGAPSPIGFGDPGLSGVVISLLKRYKPPVGAPFIFWLKAAAIGVGRVGMAGSLPLASLLLNCELNGVAGDLSPSSRLVTDRLRLFIFCRLEEEKFFFNPVLDGARPGEPDRGTCPLESISFVNVLKRVGVGGDKISVGLGAGKGEEAWRPDCGIGGGNVPIPCDG